MRVDSEGRTPERKPPSEARKNTASVDFTISLYTQLAVLKVHPKKIHPLPVRCRQIPVPLKPIPVDIRIKIPITILFPRDLRMIESRVQT